MGADNKFIKALLGGKEGWIAIGSIVGILAIATQVGKAMRSHKQTSSPRLKTLDTIYQNDSAYIVHIQVDSAFETKEDNDPPERN